MQHIHALELPPELPELSLMFGSRADGLNLSRPCERSACSWHRSGHVKGGFAVCIGGGDRRGVNRHDSCRVVARGAAQMCVGCVRCCLSGLPARGPGRRCDLAEPQGPQPRPRGGRDGAARATRTSPDRHVSRGRGPRSAARGVRSRRTASGPWELGLLGPAGAVPSGASGPRRRARRRGAPSGVRRRRPRPGHKSQPINVSTKSLSGA